MYTQNCFIIQCRSALFNCWFYCIITIIINWCYYCASERLFITTWSLQRAHPLPKGRIDQKEVTGIYALCSLNCVTYLSCRGVIKQLLLSWIISWVHSWPVMNLSELKSQKELHALASTGSRTGITVDPHRRAGEYRREGWSTHCTMYYCKTSSMRYAENKMLSLCACPANKQRKSNASEDPGYVYLIVEPPNSWWAYCTIVW